MVGEEEFDYECLKLEHRPAPARQCTSDDEQLPKHNQAFRMFSRPDIIKYTDEKSCLIDAVNMAVNQPVLTRDGLGLTDEVMVNLSHDNVVTALKTAKIALVSIKCTNSLPGKHSTPPRLDQVLKQKSGVWIVDFVWNNTEGNGVAHAVAVNCDLRLVFCNTLGALPFSLAETPGSYLLGETAATHKNVATRLGLRVVTRVWQVLKKE